MKTIVYDVTFWNDETEKNIEKAAKVLRDGGIVAFPTETVYGLGADALNAEAVSSIYKAKGRPSDNPLIVHVADVAQCESLAAVWPETAQKLAAAFWPGPLTIVLPKKETVPDITTGGLATVAIRMPDHRAALALIRRAGCPVAAPSANLSGRPSPTKGSHVAQDMDGRIPVILSGEDCRVGIESTVLDLSSGSPVILRPGILTPEAIELAIGMPVCFDPSLFSKKAWEEDDRKEIVKSENRGSNPKPKAPGMKYKHYAPKAEMIVLKGEEQTVYNALGQLQRERESAGQKVGVVFFEAEAFEKAAHDFFAKLRELDEQGVDLILAGAMDEENSVGFAIMNRMLKSASYQIIEV